eukprot:COSAG06_NODE_1028_length_11022_cov_3.872379_8_plen_175_part_00
MRAGAWQRSQIGASRRNTGCHEPPSATSLICVAHRAAGRLSRSACVRVRPAGTGCIAGVSCRAAAPSSCSNRSNSGFSACFGICPSLSTSADLHTSRSAGSQAGSVTALASASRGTVSCTMLTAVRAGALPTGGLGSVWVVMDRSRRHRLEPSALPLYRTSLPPRLTCVFASTR